MVLLILILFFLLAGSLPRSYRFSTYGALIIKVDKPPSVLSASWCLLFFCSSRVIDALGHTSTPLRPVRRQLSSLLPADAHALQVAFHDVYPVHPWPSRLPLVSFQFPLLRGRGVLESSIRRICPNHLSLLSYSWCLSYSIFLYSLFF